MDRRSRGELPTSGSGLFHRRAPGALVPTRSEVANALSASSEWATERDLPDPVAHADLISNAGLVHHRLVERARQERFPLAADRYPLPKSRGARTLVWLDPYGDIALRVLVGRCSAAMRRACGGDIFSYRLETDGAGWRTLTPQQATQLRRARGQRLLRDQSCGALAVFDVKDYYASIDLDLLENQLRDIRAPEGATEVLIKALRALADESSIRGLPIGFEGSGPLANVYLMAADKVHAHARVGLVRYTDDSWLFLRRTAEWEAARSEYVALLSALRLELNAEKSDVYDRAWDDAEGVISNALLDYVTGGGSKRLSAAEAAELLDGAAEDKDWRTARFALGALKSYNDPRGVEFLEREPDAFDHLAKTAADYLIALSHGGASSRSSVHATWLAELATRSGDARTLAGQLHACRVLANGPRVSKGIGSRLYDLAVSPKEGQARVPLQTWAAFAWSRSEHWKAGRAMEAVRDKGSFSLRRSFVLGCAARPLGKHATHLRRLTKLEPDLGPTIEYAIR